MSSRVAPENSEVGRAVPEMVLSSWGQVLLLECQNTRPDPRYTALDHHTRINCLAFARNLYPILELLDGAVTGLTEEFDATAEAKCELQSILT